MYSLAYGSIRYKRKLEQLWKICDQLSKRLVDAYGRYGCSENITHLKEKTYGKLQQHGNHERNYEGQGRV